MTSAPIDLSGGFIPMQQPAPRVGAQVGPIPVPAPAVRTDSQRAKVGPIPAPQTASAPIDISAGLVPRATPAANPSVGGGLLEGDPSFTGSTALENLKDVGVGVAKEGTQLASGAYGFGRGVIDRLPGVKDSAFGQEMQQHQQTLDAAATPQNDTQTAGKYLGEAASFMLPAKAEETLTALAPHELRFLARLGASALSSETMNDLNGGTPGVGAATGALSTLGGEGVAKLAPGLVRSAIPGAPGGGKISADDATALLNETRSIRARTLLPEVTSRIAGAANDLDARVAAAPWASVPLNTAMDPLQKYMMMAQMERVPSNTSQVGEVMDFLRGHGDYGPARPTVGGQPMVGPVQSGAVRPMVGGDVVVSPQEALDARRGLDKNFLSSAKWDKVANPDATAAAKLSYHNLTEQLHAAVPGSQEADELMSKLIPVQTGLKQLMKNDPSIVGNVAGRMAARTGALTSMAAGAAIGMPHGPIPAVVGGALGLVAPEIMTSPVVKLALARGLYGAGNPAANRLIRAGITPGVQRVLDMIRSSGTAPQGQ